MADCDFCSKTVSSKSACESSNCKVERIQEEQSALFSFQKVFKEITVLRNDSNLNNMAYCLKKVDNPAQEDI